MFASHRTAKQCLDAVKAENRDFYAPEVKTVLYSLCERQLQLYDKSSKDLLKKLFDEASGIEVMGEDEMRMIWITADRGPVEAFADPKSTVGRGRFREYRTMKELQESWLSFYPRPVCWFPLVVARYRDTVSMSLMHQEPVFLDESFENEEYDRYGDILNPLLEWLIKKVKDAKEMMKAGTYNEWVEKELDISSRTGVIKRRDLWDAIPGSREAVLEELTDAEIETFLKHAEKLPKAKESAYSSSAYPKTGLKAMTANDYFERCMDGYKANHIFVDGKTPRQAYERWADGRCGRLLDLDGNDPDAFAAWLSNRYNNYKDMGSHPWEVIRGGNSTHVDFLPVQLDDGTYAYMLSGKHRLMEVVRFFNAVSEKDLPIGLYDANEIIAAVKGEDLVGIVPEGIFPRYCETLFEGQHVIDFMRLHREDEEALLPYITWQHEQEAHLVAEKAGEETWYT